MYRERVKTALGHKTLNTISGKQNYDITGIKKFTSALDTTQASSRKMRSFLSSIIYLQEAEEKYLLQEPPQSWFFSNLVSVPSFSVSILISVPACSC